MSQSIPKDPMEDVLDFIRTGFPDEASGIAGLRSWVDGLGKGLEAPAIDHTEAVIAGVKVAQFVPPGAYAASAILYLHGGAFIAGSARSHGPLAASLAHLAGMVCVLPEYRLAPEDTYPAALDDVRAVYRGLAEKGYQIALVGDSAGGGLAIALALDLLERDLAQPSCFSLISPWVDLTLSGRSMTERAHLDPMITPEALQAGVTSYSGNLSAADPRLSPLFADLGGLSPVQIQVGGRERIYDDASRLTDRLREAGVDVAFREWREMIHVWPLFGSFLPEGPAAMEEIARFVKRHMDTGYSS